MRVSHELDSLFLGAETGEGTLYFARPGRDGRTWVRYDVRPDGTLANGRVVFGSGESAGWRGFPDL